MGIAGTLLWMMFVMLLLHLAVPSEYMRRDRAGNKIYYVLWALMLGSALFAHYRLMAPAGHGMAALVADAIAFALFFIGHFSLKYLRRRRDADTAQQTREFTVEHFPSAHDDHLSRSQTLSPSLNAYTHSVFLPRKEE